MAIPFAGNFDLRSIYFQSGFINDSDGSLERSMSRVILEHVCLWKYRNILLRSHSKSNLPETEMSKIMALLVVASYQMYLPPSKGTKIGHCLNYVTCLILPSTLSGEQIKFVCNHQITFQN